MPLFEEWPHNWFGVWKLDAEEPFEAPLFSQVVDHSWRPPDLGELVAYLRDCPVAITSGAPPGNCWLCGQVLWELNTQRSDGVWVWPSSLEHYVAEHHVRLPDRMVGHIRARQHRIPTEKDLAGNSHYITAGMLQPPPS